MRSYRDAQQPRHAADGDLVAGARASSSAADSWWASAKRRPRLGGKNPALSMGPSCLVTCAQSPRATTGFGGAALDARIGVS